MKCDKGMHHLRFYGCVPNKMRMNQFLERFDITPTDLHYDVETSWNDYELEHYKQNDIGTLYDRWFNKNKDWIKPIIVDVAKRDYKVKII